MKKIVLWLIQTYQKYLSPDHSFWSRDRAPYCRYYPSCSSYGHEAIERFGIFRGSYMAISRIIRCRPGSKGGIDLVPQIPSNSCSCSKK